MKHLKIIFILIILVSGCCPKDFSKKCVKNKSLDGLYEINNSRFYEFISSYGQQPPKFNKVKIYHDKSNYFFDLLNNDNLVKTVKLKLKSRRSGVFERPENHHFSSFILFTSFGGYNRYFGINSNNNLITYSNYSGSVYFLILPTPIHGCSPWFVKNDFESKRIE
jgi:hypothetical protein